MNKVKHYLPGLILLLLFLVAGSVILNDYGISYDEFIQQNIGEVNYKYVFNNDRELDNFLDREYGVGFEVPLIILEKAFNLTDHSDIYAMRHLVTHCLFLLCMFAGYVLALKLYKNQLVAIAAFLMLVLCPRIYAHSFFNTKDIPSLSIVVLCFLATYNALNKRTIFSFSILGALCGYAVGLRLMNMIIAGPILAYLTIDIISSIKKPKQSLALIISLILFFIIACLTMYATWPALWRDVYNDIFIFYEHLSKFRWLGSVLLNGKIIAATELPWYYIPLWFTITIPIYWLILGIWGIIATLMLFIKKPTTIINDITIRMLLMFVCCFIGPVAVVIYLKAVLYDDWRHLYFIYPSFVFLATFGLKTLLETRIKQLSILLFGVQLITLIYFCIKYHPNQNVYFNELVSHKQDNLMQHYELDYWQQSYRQGLMWIADHTAKDSIYINDKLLLIRNLKCLDTSIRKRFITTDVDSNIDYHLEVFRTDAYKYSRAEAIHEITVLGSPILRIKKMK